MSATEPTLKALVQGARAGNAEDFRVLYERFAPMVHSVAIGVLGCSDAEDVTQDVFLQAWASIGELRDADRCGPWLATMARNRARRLAARSKGGPFDDRQAVDEVGAAAWVEEPQGEHLEVDRLLAHLAQLPDAYRLPLTMRLVEGCSGPEIAQALGRPPASVRVNLHRGMQLLRTRLRRELRIT